jgi:hypothetical protein
MNPNAKEFRYIPKVKPPVDRILKHGRGIADRTLGIDEFRRIKMGSALVALIAIG